MKTSKRLFLSKRSSVSLIVIGALALLTFFPSSENAAVDVPASYECDFLSHTMAGPVDSSILFANASRCVGCHGKDTLGLALVDLEGQDVNMYDDWSATLMANSAKDPFWRAKVSHEVTTNPAHKLGLETKCTSCHAPMGHFTAVMRGAEHYTMDDLLQDTTGLDGVSCGACHQIKEEKLGKLFSGEILYDTNRVIFGPYEEPFLPPMTTFVGFQPAYVPYMGDAGMCASCHTLVTETVDLDGEYTGGTFVEQATYHEWLNSKFAVENITCQSCHMPQITDPVVISSNYLFLEGRTPYGLHELAGGNVHMLEIMKEYREALDITATPENFDETIDATLKMLQSKTLDLSIQKVEVLEDSLLVELKLFNKAGHKFPSGFPSRKTFVEFLLIDSETQDTLFHSGKIDEDYTLPQEDYPYEPHYSTIQSEDEVQIYELVLGDVNGDITTVLERADEGLKDNRLPPEGFTTDHEVYDTTLILGEALNDNDFNYDFDLNQEGSGADIVKYKVNLKGFAGMVQCIAKVHYQSIPPRWLDEIFDLSTPEIDTFKNMYESIKAKPILIDEVMQDSIVLDFCSNVDWLNDQFEVVLSPNPTKGELRVLNNTSLPIRKIRVFDAAGRLMKAYQNARPTYQLPEKSGVYFVEIFVGDKRIVRKVIKR